MTGFYQLMSQFAAYQHDLLDLSDDDFDKLNGEILNKVDSYYDWIDFLDSESARIKAQADVLAKRAKAISALAERTRVRAISALELSGLPEASGDVWRMCVKRSRYTEISVEPTYQHYNRYALDYPQLIRVGYELSKSALKELLENPACADDIKALGAIKERASLTFKPRSKVK